MAPVAPFSPFQDQAFTGIQQAQGMAQPYFGAGSQYLTGSAAPVTGEDVAGYYNPMAGNVMAGMQDVFGQQMREATMRGVQQAGGTSADRIGVAQANLAKQQGLAAGQTLAGLYYPALQAAQQQKQMMAGAGYGLGQMGPAAQNAQLQGLQAMLGAGGMQQNLAQQYMNALYQNRLAQIGYPFQTPQYLSGIAGSLAPAMGGVTQGQSQTWAPQPSTLSQVLGVGTSLLGLGMMPFTGGTSLGLLGGLQGTGFGNLLGLSSPGTGLFSGYKRGGRAAHYPTHMKGGGTPPPLPAPPSAVYNPKPIGQSAALASYIPMGGLSTEDALAQAAPYFKWYGGLPDVMKSQISGMTTPAAQRVEAAMPPPIPQISRPAPSRRMRVAFVDSLPDLTQQYSSINRNESYGAASGGAVEPYDIGQPFQFGGPPHSPFSGLKGAGMPNTASLNTGPPMLPAMQNAVTGINNMGRFQEGGEVDNPFTVDQPHFDFGDVLSAAKKYYAPNVNKVSSPSMTPTMGGPDIPSEGPAQAASPEEAVAFLSQTDAATLPMGGAGVPLPQSRPDIAGVPLPQSRPDIAGAPGQAFASATRTGLSPSRDSIRQDVLSSANKYGIPPVIAERLVNRESGFNPNVRGAAGEVGLMQLMPGTARELGVNPFDISQNIDGGMRYLRQQYDRFGNWPQAIAAYNAGPGAVASGRIPASTRNYVADVTSGAPIQTAEDTGPVRGFTPAAYRGPMGGMDDYQMPRERMPYPGSDQMDWGQRMVRSPWMSLVAAGAKMASTPGPIGSVIGKGIEAGVGALEGERKALRDETAINLKAQSLWQAAKEHLDRYQKMTPYQQASLEQGKYTYVGTDDEGYPILLNHKTGETERSPTKFASVVGGTALQRNANWLVSNGIAPDLKTAYEMVHSGVNEPIALNRAIEAAKKNLIAEGSGLTGNELEQKARQLVKERFPNTKIGGPTQTAQPMPTDKSQLQDGILYNTPRGPAVWDANKDRFRSP